MAKSIAVLARIRCGGHIKPMRQASARILFRESSTSYERMSATIRQRQISLNPAGVSTSESYPESFATD
jgi:hypothetical protein